MEFSTFERAIKAANQLIIECPSGIADGRRLAVAVQQAGAREFGASSEIGQLARTVRSQVHEGFGDAGFNAVCNLLDALTTRYAKQQGKDTFESAIKLYVWLISSGLSRDPDRLSLLMTYLTGQSNKPAGTATEYVERWHAILGTASTKISEQLVQQIRQAVQTVLSQHRLSAMTDILADELYIFSYAVANILPDKNEEVRLGSPAELPAFLESEFAAWYFMGFGSKLTESQVRETLQNRGYPLYYERYLSHWLVQYGLLVVCSRELGDWYTDVKTSDKVRADFTQIFEEYILTEAHRAEVLDFDSYTDNLANLHFRSKSAASTRKFKTSFLKKAKLTKPTELLSAIEQSDYFRLTLTR